MSELQLAKIHRDISPQRNKPKPTCLEHSNGKGKSRVPVVYYLSRNGQLEHPHFMEIPLSSPHLGLFLRDVINRLNVLRGKGMASLYSWSCKRSYKNGFVWHDLSDNDLVYPAHAQEYVLKGSLLLPEDKAFPERYSQPLHPPPEFHPSCVDSRRRNQSCSSIDFSPEEYSIYKMESSSSSGRSAAADASTQTDDGRRRRRRTPPEEDCTKKEAPREEIEISPPPSDSSPETLEKLMKAEGGRLILRPEPASQASTGGGRAAGPSKSSVLMQLITCGTISFKDCGHAGGLGFISNYKVRTPRVKLEEREFFIGSLVETQEQGIPTMNGSTSYNGDR